MINLSDHRVIIKACDYCPHAPSMCAGDVDICATRFIKWVAGRTLKTKHIKEVTTCEN